MSKADLRSLNRFINIGENVINHIIDYVFPVLAVITLVVSICAQARMS